MEPTEQGAWLAHGEGYTRPIAAEGVTRKDAFDGFIEIAAQQQSELWSKEAHRRQYQISYNPKPIPDRNHDWEFIHQDYDGPPDNRCGTAASQEDAIHQIDLIWENDNA